MSSLIFGKYAIIQRLAVGGMGEVFLARQTGTPGFERYAILKSLLPELAALPSAVNEFLDEARVAATLNHPNVVSIYEVGLWEGSYYLAMEFIDGDNLAGLRRSALARGQLFPCEVTACIVRDAALGLDHAHRARDLSGKPMEIVHRDISPQNIMVRRDGVTKVVDFGIARAANRATRTATGMTKGKLAYMPPEQLRALGVDGRSDQFALGVVLWELLAGRRLFHADSDVELLQQVLRGEVHRPSRIDVPVPEALEAITMQMLQADPTRRFPSCQAVADALAAWLGEVAPGFGTAQVAQFVLAVGGDAGGRAETGTVPEQNFVIDLHAPAPAAGPEVTQPTVADARRAGPLPIEHPGGPRASAPVRMVAPPPPEGGRRRTWLQEGAAIAALVLLVAGGSVFAVLRRQAASDPCHDPEGKLAGIWDTTVRQRLHAAITSGGTPEAATTATYAEKAMDRASGAWLAAFRDACDATRIRQVQSEAALNLRLECLDDQRFDLEAAVETMVQLGPKELSSTIGAVARIPLPLECADARALSVIEQPSAELRPRVKAVRLQLGRGVALHGAGKYPEALEVLKTLPEEAHALGATALEALALTELGDVHGDRGDRGDQGPAIDLHAQAALLAEAAHLDQLATRAAAALASNKARFGRPPAEVDAALEQARGDLRRAGLGGRAEFYVERAVNLIDVLRGANEHTVEHVRREMELAETLFGADRQETLITANNAALVMEEFGRYDEAVRLLQEAVGGQDALLGPQTVLAATPQLNLTEILVELGRLPEAEKNITQFFERMNPTIDDPGLAIGLAVQSSVQAVQGQRAQSLQTLGRAIEMGTRLHVLDVPDDVDLPLHAAEAYLYDGLPDQARDIYAQYLAHQDIAAGNPSWVQYLRLGGWAYLEAGQPEVAQPLLERALKLAAAHPFYPGWAARLRYQTARALMLAHREPERAEALARAASQELQGVASCAGLLREIDDWSDKAFGNRVSGAAPGR